MNYVEVLNSSRKWEAGRKKRETSVKWKDGNTQCKKAAIKWREVSSGRGTLILWYFRFPDCIPMLGNQYFYNVRSLW